MTVFITPFWKKRLERCLLLITGLIWAGGLLAGSIEPKQAELTPDEQGMVLSAQFAIILGTRLEDAVTRGVPLSFRLEFTLARKRKYWLDEHITGAVRESRLSYQALTRQYRLSIDGLHRNFDSLDAALAALGRISGWPVVATGQWQAGETYLAAVRLSLDHEQLPKPLQVDALADRDWRVGAQTHRWQITP